MLIAYYRCLQARVRSHLTHRSIFSSGSLHMHLAFTKYPSHFTVSLALLSQAPFLARHFTSIPCLTSSLTCLDFRICTLGPLIGDASPYRSCCTSSPLPQPQPSPTWTTTPSPFHNILYHRSQYRHGHIHSLAVWLALMHKSGLSAA